MSDLDFFLLFAVIALGVAWLVNSLVALLSGEHPRDTPSVWLDIVFAELRALNEGLPFIRRRWFRWMIATVLGGAVFAVLFFVFHG